jgi:5-methylcytosine-specific restriction endonuclease McrA
MNHARRVAKHGGEIEQFDAREVFDRDNWKCGICGKKIDKDKAWPNLDCASLDHIVPVSKGGGHTRSNTRATHLHCNVSRQDRGGGQMMLGYVTH